MEVKNGGVAQSGNAAVFGDLGVVDCEHEVRRDPFHHCRASSRRKLRSSAMISRAIAIRRSSEGAQFAAAIGDLLGSKVCVVPVAEVDQSSGTTIGLGDAFVGGFLARPYLAAHGPQ